MKKPDALDLAKSIETYLEGKLSKLAAAELRRLHEVNQELIKTLESIEDMYSYDQTLGEASAALYEARNTARYALAKAKGEQND
jgi:predicted transglutaminase-like cysteine proteinase